MQSPLKYANASDKTNQIDQDSGNSLNPLSPLVVYEKSRPAFTCSKHCKKAIAICTHSDCLEHFLCPLDLKGHSHADCTYMIDHLSDPSFLENMFAASDTTHTQYKSYINNSLKEIQRKFNLLFDQLNKKVLQNIKFELESLDIFGIYKNLINLQDIFLQKKSEENLESLAREVDLVLSEKLKSDDFQKLFSISQIYKNSLKKIDDVSKSLCDFFADKIHGMTKATVNNKNLKFEQTNSSKALNLMLSSKIDRLSISNVYTYKISLEPKLENNIENILSKFLALQKLANHETMLNKRQTIELNGSARFSSIERDKRWNGGYESLKTLGRVLLPEVVYTEEENTQFSTDSKSEEIINDFEKTESMDSDKK
jgi:hypothetical protein